jgi:hypothetical protein
LVGTHKPMPRSLNCVLGFLQCLRRGALALSEALTT